MSEAHDIYFTHTCTPRLMLEVHLQCGHGTTQVQDIAANGELKYLRCWTCCI